MVPIPKARITIGIESKVARTMFGLSSEYIHTPEMIPSPRRLDSSSKRREEGCEGVSMVVLTISVTEVVIAWRTRSGLIELSKCERQLPRDLCPCQRQNRAPVLYRTVRRRPSMPVLWNKFSGTLASVSDTSKTPRNL